VHPYSGLDPTSWQRFRNNLRLFNSKIDSDIDVAAQALYTAVENIRDMSLALRRADDGTYQDRLNDIASALAYEGEFELNKVALDKGLYFFPKYLNETIQDYPEDGAGTFYRPGLVRSHGQ
jgi:hypothetical protein